ncbi:MAG: SRPBCC domain-containing protein [Amphiplicatus sp.]
MKPTDIMYETLHFERLIAAPVAPLFRAFADAREREKWSAPSDSAAFFYEEEDFRPGGVDRFRCGSKEAPQYEGETRYLAIEENALIACSEVVQAGGARLFASLNTTRFQPCKDGTRLVHTVQIASFAGEDMITGARVGTNAAFDNLAALFA